jgi:hypothetical protein
MTCFACSVIKINIMDEKLYRMDELHLEEPLLALLMTPRPLQYCWEFQSIMKEKGLTILHDSA